jgi:hypothetical protein
MIGRNPVSILRQFTKAAASIIAAYCSGQRLANAHLGLANSPIQA